MEIIAVSKYYRLHQDTTTRDFYLEIPGDYYRMKFCQLLLFRNQLNQIDIVTHFDIHNSNTEVIPIGDCKQYLFLNTLQILDLKKLFAQVFNTQNKKTKRLSVA